jgi:anti-sigma-K factor RskA
MEHEEIESLLGAYALDAVLPEEAAAIETHLATCPRCRAEVSAHREVVALLATSGAEAPFGVWDRIAAELHGDDAPAVLQPSSVLTQIHARDPRRRKPWRRRLPLALAAAAVAAALALLGVQVSHLGNEVNQYQKAAEGGGLAPAVASVLSGPHRTITLTDAQGTKSGTVAVAGDGEAYWVAANLASLPAGRTYQLWALANGRVVSLGLLGANPHTYSAFRIQSDVTVLMVTSEPEGGTASPTTNPVVQADVSTS